MHGSLRSGRHSGVLLAHLAVQRIELSGELLDVRVQRRQLRRAVVAHARDRLVRAARGRANSGLQFVAHAQHLQRHVLPHVLQQTRLPHARHLVRRVGAQFGAQRAQLLLDVVVQRLAQFGGDLGAQCGYDTGGERGIDGGDELVLLRRGPLAQRTALFVAPLRQLRVH